MGTPHAEAAAPLIGEHRVETAAQMQQLGARIAAELKAGDVLVLTGELGAGKTTMTRGIGKALNVRGPVQSPTFVLARTHPQLDGGTPLVHVDAYRLSSALELDDLDIPWQKSIVVIEWGRGLIEHIKDQWWDVELIRQIGLESQNNAQSLDPNTQLNPEELDADAPRLVRIKRYPATLET